MKNLIIALTLIAAAFGCDPIDSADQDRSQSVRGYAHYCVNQIWSDTRLAQYNMMDHLTHREVYEKCVADYDRKSIVLIMEEVDF